MKKASIQKIIIKSWFNLAESDYPYETYDFIIDFENKTAYFKEKSIYRHSINWMLNDENRLAFKKIHSYYSTDKFPLNNISPKEIRSPINNLKEWCDRNTIDNNLRKPAFYSITVRYDNDEEDYIKIYNAFPEELIDLSNTLKRSVGIDVFNLNNLKSLVTEHDYIISQDKVCDRKTSEELTLKRIDYSIECGSLFKRVKNCFHMDLNKKILKDFDENRIRLSDEDIDGINLLIKRYGVYKWNSPDCASNNDGCALDGCNWRLSLVFDGSQVLNIGGRQEKYPATYGEFGRELNDLFKRNLLEIPNNKSVPYTIIKLDKEIL